MSCEIDGTLCTWYNTRLMLIYFLATCTFALFDGLGSYLIFLPTSMNVNVTNIRIKGRFFHRDRIVPVGTALNLVREPMNPYDPNAIKVTYADRPNEVIGYVPAVHARTLAAYMDSGLYQVTNALAVPAFQFYEHEQDPNDNVDLNYTLTSLAGRSRMNVAAYCFAYSS